MNKQSLTVEIEAQLLENPAVIAALKNLWMVIDHQQGGSIDNSETFDLALKETQDYFKAKSYRTLGDVIRAPDFVY